MPLSRPETASCLSWGLQAELPTQAELGELGLGSAIQKWPSLGKSARLINLAPHKLLARLRVTSLGSKTKTDLSCTPQADGQTGPHLPLARGRLYASHCKVRLYHLATLLHASLRATHTLRSVSAQCVW